MWFASFKLYIHHQPFSHHYLFLCSMQGELVSLSNAHSSYLILCSVLFNLLSPRLPAGRCHRESILIFLVIWWLLHETKKGKKNSRQREGEWYTGVAVCGDKGKERSSRKTTRSANCRDELEKSSNLLILMSILIIICIGFSCSYSWSPILCSYLHFFLPLYGINSSLFCFHE